MDAKNKGQAVVEYVLLLIVSVSLILLVIKVFFEPAQNYLSRLLGKDGYYACLLETGELPQLTAEDDSAECILPRLQSGDGAELGSSQSASRSRQNSASNEGEDSSSSSSKGEGGAAAGLSGASSAGRPGRFAQSISRSNIRTRGAEGRSSQKTVEITLDSGSSGSDYGPGQFSSFRRGNRGRVTYIPIYGLSEEQRKKIERKGSVKQRTIALDESLNPSPKKIPIKKPEVKSQLKETQEDEFTLGGFLRLLIIIGILIAILVFVGGQALQLSKGFDKS